MWVTMNKHSGLMFQNQSVFDATAFLGAISWKTAVLEKEKKGQSPVWWPDNGETVTLPGSRSTRLSAVTAVKADSWADEWSEPCYGLMRSPLFFFNLLLFNILGVTFLWFTLQRQGQQLYRFNEVNSEKKEMQHTVVNASQCIPSLC